MSIEFNQYFFRFNPFSALLHNFLEIIVCIAHCVYSFARVLFILFFYMSIIVKEHSSFLFPPKREIIESAEKLLLIN